MAENYRLNAVGITDNNCFYESWSLGDSKNSVLVTEPKFMMWDRESASLKELSHESELLNDGL